MPFILFIMVVIFITMIVAITTVKRERRNFLTMLVEDVIENLDMDNFWIYQIDQKEGFKKLHFTIYCSNCKFFESDSNRTHIENKVEEFCNIMSIKLNKPVGASVSVTNAFARNK